MQRINIKLEFGHHFPAPKVRLLGLQLFSISIIQFVQGFHYWGLTTCNAKVHCQDASLDKNSLGLTKTKSFVTMPKVKKNTGIHKRNIQFTKTQQFWNARGETRPNPSSLAIECIWFVSCKVEVTLEVSTRKHKKIDSTSRLDGVERVLPKAFQKC